jgi:hypothetical protein
VSNLLPTALTVTDEDGDVSWLWTSFGCTKARHEAEKHPIHIIDDNTKNTEVFRFWAGSIAFILIIVVIVMKWPVVVRNCEK